MNYLKYFFIFIFLISICINLQLETRILLSIFLSSLGVYFIYMKDIKSDVTLTKENKKISNKKQMIHKNEKFLEIVQEINVFKKYNKKTYNDFLIHLDNFLIILDDINYKDIKLRHMFENLLNERKKMLNTISSMIYSCPKIYESLLEKNIDKLDRLSYNYIKTAENKLNNLWLDNIDNSKFEYDIDEPKANDINIENNYELY